MPHTASRFGFAVARKAGDSLKRSGGGGMPTIQQSPLKSKSEVIRGK